MVNFARLAGFDYKTHPGSGALADQVMVQAGRGLFTIGEERFEAGPGEVVWAAAEVPHGVENAGAERLVLVTGIAPWR